MSFIRSGEGGLPSKASWAALPMLVLPAPAKAECLGGGCLDGLVILLAMVVVYGLIALVLLVMVLRRKWRRAGVISLVVVLAVAIGVPMVSQGWQAWKHARMESREVVGAPPLMAFKTPLLIAPDQDCFEDLCDRMVSGGHLPSVYFLPLSALKGLDLTQPISLADLPLEYWQRPVQLEGEPQGRTLSIAGRQVAAGQIDYLVLAAHPFFRSEPGAIEAALRANKALGGMREGELLQALMAPLDPAIGTLDLSRMQFDLLDLWLVDPALAVPLAPMNWQPAKNRNRIAEVAARSLCAAKQGVVEWDCREALE